MASIKYYPYSEKPNSRVYVRISFGRGRDFRLSTTQTIHNPKTWNYEINLPKKNSDENKLLHKNLYDLSSEIEAFISNIEKDPAKSTYEITSRDFKTLIRDFFNENKIEHYDYFVPVARTIIAGLKSKTYMKNGVRYHYTEDSIYKYNNVIRHIEEYEIFKGKKFKIKDIDYKFVDSFLEYLFEEKDLSINTNGRYAPRIKTLVKWIKEAGFQVNPNYKSIKKFEDETIVTFLTMDEIEKIISTDMPTEKLQIAKDWLIIGCFTGQRISDLYRMNKNMLKREIEDDGEIIWWLDFKQFKGKGLNGVKIPLHFYVEDILKKYDMDFPPNIYENEKSNRAQLTALMKEVCKIAGITHTVYGRRNGKKGYYAKNELIGSHTCRRTFATLFYGKEGWTAETICKLTGHKTVRSLLRYIDKEDDSLNRIAAANFKKMKQERNNPKTQLAVVRRA